jgi:hypothetical protein
VKGPLEKDSHVQAVGGEIQVEPVVGSPSPTAEKYGNLLSGIGQGKLNGPSKPVTTDSILSMVVLVG